MADYDITKDPPVVYGGYNMDEYTRITSTSGGVFSLLAAAVIRDGGCVVGAAYGEGWMVRHKLIDHASEIVQLKQSKYVQSNTGDVFREIKKVLDTGRNVLFSGTPCQSAGLQAYLGTSHDRLTTCDFVCKGVISPLVYRKYLDMLEMRYNSKIARVTFKEKSRGWNGFCTAVDFENGERYIADRNTDPYMVGYLRHNLYLRPCCHACRYKTLPRVSDLTFGDFWGIAKTRPHLDDNKGTSFIMVNSSKGHALFDAIKAHMMYESCTIEEVAVGNACLYQSSPVGQHRGPFFASIIDHTFDTAMEMALSEGGKLC